MNIQNQVLIIVFVVWRTHNSLPNIVGLWLPQCDREENTKSYYYTSMLAFLKPWRNLHELKCSDEDWETAFNEYMTTASRRDRDVVTGCQYYYETKQVAMNRSGEEEIEMEHNVNDDDNNEMEFDDESQINPTKMLVSHLY